MNEKTKNQITEMKKQIIGVEIEMNNITKENTAKLVAGFFGTGRYKDTACRNGYYTWSAWDVQGREWKFQKDVSIAGPDREKCEMVTPHPHLHRYGNLAGTNATATQSQSQERCYQRMRSPHPYRSPEPHPAEPAEPDQHYDKPRSLLADALALDRGRMNCYCRTVNPRFLESLNRKKPATMAQLADIWYTSHGADYGHNQHYNDSRYHMLYDYALSST